MGFLSRLFGTRAPDSQLTTAIRPLSIASPSIGFLNLQGAAGAACATSDQEVLAPLFTTARTSAHEVPKCDVLFVYCSFDATGNIDGDPRRMRDLIREAGAYVAVGACENVPEHSFKAIDGDNGWTANIVLVMERRNDKFVLFFRRLFRAMLDGESMLMAWVALAPQMPGHDHPDAPISILVPEAGHVTFDG